MLYSLIVLKELHLPDGRIFMPGHDCHALSAAEVKELVTNFPDRFEGADENTKDFIERLNEISGGD